MPQLDHNDYRLWCFVQTFSTNEGCSANVTGDALLCTLVYTCFEIEIEDVWNFYSTSPIQQEVGQAGKNALDGVKKEGMWDRETDQGRNDTRVYKIQREPKLGRNISQRG